MAQYRVQDPQGQEHIIEGPDNATPDEVMQQAQALIPSGQSRSMAGPADLNASNPTFAQDANYPPEATVPAEQRVLNAVGSTASGLQMGRGLASLATAGVNAIAPTKFGQALSQTPQTIGAKMGAGETAAGIGDKLPELRGNKIRFPQPEMNVPVKSPKPVVPAETLPNVPPTSYPSDPNTFVNAVQDRIEKFGDRLSPQELSDMKSQLTTFANTGKFDFTTKAGAVAAKTIKKVSELHANAIEGRSELNSIYGLSKMLHPDVLGTLKEYAAKYGKSIAVGAGAGLGYKLTK